MQELLNKPVDERDEAWELEFFKQIPNAQFEFLSESPIEGPDGMPYLAVRVAETGEPANNVFNWLGEQGVGLAVNPDKETPDYVFSYGMIWNFLLNGEFMTDVEDPQSGKKEFEVEPGQQMMAGTPSETYFPPHVRKVFREFMVQQGVHRPRVVMLSQDGKNYDLCFSLQSLGNPPDKEWQGILEGFSWFFPLHYSFSILSEDMIQGIDFVDI